MLGSKMAQLCQKAGHSLLTPNHTILDVSDKVQIDGFFKANAFDVLVNCAAYTKVDACEEREGSNQAYAVNGVGVGFLAAACKENGRLLVHFSTDYVFDGQKGTPYQEGDPTGPINVYGQTKLMGEKEIREAGPKFYLIRTSWVFGPNGPNFVKTIAGLLKTKPKLPVVTDQVGGPTYTGDLAQFVLELIDRKAESGFYHFANGGYTSWNGFAREIQRLIGAVSCEITEASSAEFVRPAKRPANSRFDLTKGTKAVGHEPRPWQEALKEYLEKELN
jgi:dTDP-4-dehydrorhamnose reductase